VSLDVFFPVLAAVHILRVNYTEMAADRTRQFAHEILT